MRLPIALALALAACNQGFEPQYLVKDLRILAVRSEAEGTNLADVAADQTLVLRALVANPLGRGGLTVTWYACPPTGTESLPPCADLSLLASPARLAADPRVLQLGTCEPDPGGVCAISTALAALAAGLAAAMSDVRACAMYAEVPVVAVARADGREHVALKRVRVVPTAEMLAAAGLTSTYVTNSNPAVSSVVRDRPNWGTCAGGIEIAPDPFPRHETTLCAVAASGWRQQFETCGAGGEPTLASEPGEWQWLTTGGEFPEFDGMTGNVNRNEPRFVRPAGPFTLWTIMRDGRGGEAWVTYEVGPPP